MNTEKMCLAKSIFWYYDHAVSKANSIAKRGGPKLRAYRCPNCKQYHLTSQI